MIILKKIDALTGLKQMVGLNKARLILSDPPFGITSNKRDVVIPIDEMWKAIDEISFDNTVSALFSLGLFHVDLINGNRKNYKYSWIWNKLSVTGHLNAKHMPMLDYEFIDIFYKKKPTYNPQMTIGKHNHSKGNKHKVVEVKNQSYGRYKPVDIVITNLKYPKRILNFPRIPQCKTIHRSEKPVELLEYFIKTYTNEGDLVVDFAMGSASTAEACINTKRDFIGFEKYDEEFEVAKSRMEKFKFNDSHQLIYICN